MYCALQVIWSLPGPVSAVLWFTSHMVSSWASVSCTVLYRSYDLFLGQGQLYCGLQVIWYLPGPGPAILCFTGHHLFHSHTTKCGLDLSINNIVHGESC